MTLHLNDTGHMTPTGISPRIQRERWFTVNKGNPVNFQTILLGLSHIKLNLVFLEDPNSDAYSLLISTQTESNFCQHDSLSNTWRKWIISFPATTPWCLMISNKAWSYPGHCLLTRLRWPVPVNALCPGVKSPPLSSCITSHKAEKHGKFWRPDHILDMDVMKIHITPIYGTGKFRGSIE